MASILKTSGVLLAGLLLVPQVFGEFGAYQLGLYLIYGIAAQGIGFLWGRTGILPLGQALFFGGMAYVSALVLKNTDGALLHMLLIFAGLAGTTFIAFVLAALVFRGRSDSGPYFSLITLALVMIAEQLAGTASSVTGGFNGLSGYPLLASLDPFGSFYYLIVAAVVVVSFVVMVVEKLPTGLIVRAIADNEPRLQLLGFPTHIVKGLAFAFSALLAGIAGVLFASHQGIVTPTSSGFLLSAKLVIWAAVGGRFHALGPLFGAVFIGLLSAELRDSFQFWEVVIALLFIIVVLKAPGGISELVVRGLAKIRATKNDRPGQYIPAPKIHAPTELAGLSFQDTFVRAGVVQILNGVTFEAPKQGILCIIGPNGAGKTTLLNVITGNIKTTVGTVMLGAERVDSRAPHKALKSGIGRKLQIPSVFFDLSVAENLDLAIMVGRAKIWDFFKFSTLRWQTDYLNGLLANKSVPLAKQLGRKAGVLSQGHKQILEFAMATACEPRVLLLDEPCAGLSTEETALMNNLIKAFQARHNGLVIVIEHDMSLVEVLSDRVLVLHEGRVLAIGNFAEIRRNKAVSEVYAGGGK